MSLNAFTEQRFAVDLCRAWLKRETTNPLLFFGPAGAGKKSLALALAQALNCATPDSEGCGTCLSCKKIANDTHPDVRVIDLAWQAAERGEPLEKQQTLKIETILKERARLLQSPGEGAWKVSIIHDAHRMTPDAANVLLKILEEPPTRTALILTTPFRDRMLATILSRCQPVRFRYVEHPESLTHEEVEARRQTEALWESLKTTSPERLVQAAEGRSRTLKVGRPEVEEQVQRLLLPASRALRGGASHAEVPVQLLQRALEQLRRNVQPTLVLDHLLVQLATAMQTGPHE